MNPASILTVLKIISTLMGIGKQGYDIYEEIFAGKKPMTSTAQMMAQLESDIKQIIHEELEHAQIDDAKAAAQAGIDFLSIDLPDYVRNHANSDSAAYLSGPDGSTALKTVQDQANVMDQWSLDSGLTTKESMMAVQTLPLYLLLANIALSIYQARAKFAADSADQQTNLQNVGQYAAQYQQRAAAVLAVLLGSRQSAVTKTTPGLVINPNPDGETDGVADLKDTWIDSHSMLKYDWHVKSSVQGNSTNIGAVIVQIDTLFGLHTGLLTSPDSYTYHAIYSAADKQDNLPRADHFDSYFGKHPAYPPTAGYVEQAYQFGMFVRYLQDTLGALQALSQNPTTPTALMQPPGAPTYDPARWSANGAGSGNWAPGFSVQYAVTFYISDGVAAPDPGSPAFETAMGAWSAAITSQTNYFPLVTQVPVDPTGLATGRKIYRQFQGQSPAFVGSLDDNIQTSFQDVSP